MNVVGLRSCHTVHLKRRIQAPLKVIVANSKPSCWTLTAKINESTDQEKL